MKWEWNISLQDVLSGNFLARDFFKNQYKYIILVVVLIFISVYSSFLWQRKEQKIASLQQEIKETRYEILDLSKEYTEMTRPSSINKRLEELNINIKESTTPSIRVK